MSSHVQLARIWMIPSAEWEDGTVAATALMCGVLVSYSHTYCVSLCPSGALGELLALANLHPKPNSHQFIDNYKPTISACFLCNNQCSHFDASRASLVISLVILITSYSLDCKVLNPRIISINVTYARKACQNHIKMLARSEISGENGIQIDHLRCTLVTHAIWT